MLHCFNPCFYGSWSQTHKYLAMSIKPEPFQSLFLWKLVLDPQALLRACPALRKFQSLFLWKLVLDFSAQHAPQAANQVSILVFMEVGLRQHASQAANQQLVMFQSLFLWKLVLDKQIKVRKAQCFPFQSLFLWKLVLDLAEEGLKKALLFVSILVFMEVGLRLCQSA